MRELKKATYICYAIQAVLVFVFVLNKVLSLQSIALIPFNTWIIPVIHFPNIILCTILFISAFNSALRKAAPDLYDDLFGQNPLGFLGYKGLGFAFRRNGENEAVNKIRAYARSHYLLVFIIYLEIVLTSVLLPA